MRLLVRRLSLMVTAWLSISSSSILVLLSGVSAVEAAFWRLVLSLPLLLAASKLMRIKASLRPYPLHFVSGFFLALHFALWMESLFLIPVSLSASIVVMYPVFSLIYEKLAGVRGSGARQFFGFTLAVLGVLLVIRPSAEYSSNLYLGSLLSLAGSLSITVYFIIGGKARRGGTSLVEYAVPTYFCASLFLLPMVVYFESSSHFPSTESFLYLLLLAILPMIGGHTVMNYLLGSLKVSTVTSVALAEPLGASFLAKIFLGQPLPPDMLVGVIIVVAGLVLAVSASS